MSYYVFGGVSKRTKSITSFALALFMVLQTVGPSIAYAVAKVPDGTEDVPKVKVCHEDEHGDWHEQEVNQNDWNNKHDDNDFKSDGEHEHNDGNNHHGDEWCHDHNPHGDKPCLIPVAVVEGDKISSFGVTSPEITLQAALDAAYGVNAINNTVSAETGIQAWTIPVGTNSVTISGKYVNAISANTQVFGYYFDGQISTFTPIFDNSVVLPGAAIAPTVINTTGHTKIGFAIDTKPSSPAKYGTEKSVNADGKDHAVVYTNPTNAKGYVIAFEDLPLTNVPTTSDADYQDMIVEINIDSCKQGGNECVPSAGSVVSDATVSNTTDGGNAVALSTINPAWTASIPGATWIWATDPVVGPTNTGMDLTKVFTKKFTITGTPNTGSLMIAVDNNYSVKVNGHALSVAFDQNNFQIGTQDTYDVSSYLVTGENTLEITATNWQSLDQSPDPAANPAGVLFKLDWTSNCGGGNGNNTPTSKVTLHKFIDGSAATTQTAEQTTFSISTHAAWGDADPSATDTSGDQLATPILNSANNYTAESHELTNNSNSFTGYEVVGDNTNILPADAQCQPGKFQIEGYSVGDSLSAAQNAVKTSSINLQNISSDKHVIVWNKTCPTKATVVATKIVCTNEADLPNWGNGAGGAITENTATAFLAAHPKTCHAQPGWTFQWAPSVATNPGDNNMSLVSPWTNSGVTAADGTVSIDIPVTTNGGFVWMREVPQEGYIPFSGDTNGSDGWNDVSAEMYCNVDHLNYDNYDRVDNMVAGQTYHCVAWNVPTHVIITNCENTDVVSEQCPQGGNHTGTIQIKKVVVDSNMSPSNFSYTVNGGEPSTFTAGGTNSFTANVGTAYTIAEVNPNTSGFVTTYDGCSNITVSNGETKTCTITNTHQTVVIDSCITNCGGGNDNHPSDEPHTPTPGGHRHGGSVAGASTNVPNVPTVLGAATDVPNLPNTGNGARSQTLMITLSLIVALFAINAVAIRKMKNS